MAGLSLTLRPRERFLVGGHLVENGPKRASITIKDDGVFVLRLSDALHPDEANTPIRRAYYVAQLILATELGEEEGAPVLLEQLGRLAQIFARTDRADTLARAVEAAEARRYHGVLTTLKSLFETEAVMLGQPVEAEVA
jgi:flagellar protein FlbT